MLDIGSGSKYMNTWKQELWDNANIGVPHLDIEANDSVIFGYLVCWFITEVSFVIIHKLSKNMKEKYNVILSPSIVDFAEAILEFLF